MVAGGSQKTFILNVVHRGFSEKPVVEFCKALSFLKLGHTCKKIKNHWSRKYRDKVNKDPVKYQEYFAREKERDRKRKETGKLKTSTILQNRKKDINANNGK